MNTAVVPFVRQLLMKHGGKNLRILIFLVIFLAMVLNLGWQIVSFNKHLTGIPRIAKGLNETNASHKTPSIRYEDFEWLFGFSDQTRQPENVKKEIPVTKLNLILRGVAANNDEAGKNSAIIQSSNQDRLYLLGDALPGGAILKSIHSDHIILQRGAQLEKLFFPEGAKDSRAFQEFRPAASTVDVAPQESADPQNEFRNYPDDMSLEERMQELRERLHDAGQEL